MKRGAARALRAEPTEAERRLWKALRDKQMGNLRFRRQQPIGPYIVDFFCPAVKLIIELDGSQHGEEGAVAYDEARTRWLQVRGYKVLRFANADFLKEPHVVLEQIWTAVKDCARG
jgi:very-short-patch-repair endonuclease